MTQEEKLEEAKRLYKDANADQRYVLESLFPELAEIEDERTRKELITHCRNTRCVTEEGAERIAKWITWLEKQGNQPIYKTPSREIILAIWDLGNEWKELTKGSISTEYGTQLDYIQKHWRESEYYLRAKQSEQKPYGQREECLDCQFNSAGECNGTCAMKRDEQKLTEWSEEDERHKNTIIRAIHGAGNITPIDGELAEKWLKSLRPQNCWKPTDEQMDALVYITRHYTPAISDTLGWESLRTVELMISQLRKL